MATIITLGISLFIIYGAAIIWCVRSSRKLYGKKPSAKIIEMNREFREMLDYKLSQEYVKTKSSC
jgi:hypothetical protein